MAMEILQQCISKVLDGVSKSAKQQSHLLNLPTDLSPAGCVTQTLTALQPASRSEAWMIVARYSPRAYKRLDFQVRSTQMQELHVLSHLDSRCSW